MLRHGALYGRAHTLAITTDVLFAVGGAAAVPRWSSSSRTHNGRAELTARHPMKNLIVCCTLLLAGVTGCDRILGPPGHSLFDFDGGVVDDGTPRDAASCATLSSCALQAIPGGSSSLVAVWGSSENDVYVIDDASGDTSILHGPAASGLFTKQDDDVVHILHSVWGSGASDVYAVGNYGLVLHTPGDGTWSTQTDPLGDYLDAVWGSSASDVYAVGNLGAIIHSTGDGTWIQQPSGTSAILNAVWGASPTSVYAVGDNGTILRSDGSTWTADVSPSTQDLKAVWGAEGRVYAVGAGGTILCSAGSGWTTETAPTTANLSAIWGASAHRFLFAAGDGGVLLHSTGDGTWQPIATGTTESLAALFGGPSFYYVVGDGGTILRAP